MAYKARTTAPAYNTDPNAISVTKGGKNHALMINSASGSVYPNCCGHVHFRALELCGAEVEERLCRNNAVAYFNYTQDGLERGQTPKLGAIAVFSGGSKGFGHVAVVECIYTNGDINTSNSNYSGNMFYMKRVTKASGYAPWSGYKLLGFIYLPWDKELPRVGTPVARNAEKYQCEVIYAALRVRKRPELNDEVIIGIANVGVYDVLETCDMTAEASNGYYWYRIGEDMWVARDDGNLTEDYPVIEIDIDALKTQIEQLTAENQKLTEANSALKTENTNLGSKISAAAEILK